MAVDWEISKTTRACSVTGRELAVGETYYSALQDEGKTFVRYDFSPAAWADCDQESFFSYWRRRMSSPEEKKRLVIDLEAFYIFFTQLEDATEEHRLLFRYLVALILTRKRVLRLEGIEKGEAGEFLVLYDRRAEKELRVFSPVATADQLEESQETLNQIFECQVGVDEL